MDFTSSDFTEETDWFQQDSGVFAKSPEALKILRDNEYNLNSPLLPDLTGLVKALEQTEIEKRFQARREIIEGYDIFSKKLKGVDYEKTLHGEDLVQWFFESLHKATECNQPVTSPQWDDYLSFLGNGKECFQAGDVFCELRDPTSKFDMGEVVKLLKRGPRGTSCKQLLENIV